ncbi:MAG: TlyA family RNA methyltransferase [Gammaproteobacteria bacterium]|nr:MAG: TlyA family RNA methyltransferase [Gammaproteobacteria bacterium]
MLRVDKLLVEQGHADTRARAQTLIKSGAVEVLMGDHWFVVTRPAARYASDATFRIQAHAALRYVSRGGLKLEGALKAAKLNVSGLRCLDVGQSTGGFTDCLLQHGAREVVGVDVGHDQLHPRLKAHPQVIALEGINARKLSEALTDNGINKHFDLAVMDVSFISQKLIAQELSQCLRPGGTLVTLVKPQFELGPDALNAKGVVKTPERFADLELSMRHLYTALNFQVQHYAPSPIRGGDGNREFLLIARSTPDGPGDASQDTPSG